MLRSVVAVKRIGDAEEYACRGFADSREGHCVLCVVGNTKECVCHGSWDAQESICCGL